MKWIHDQLRERLLARAGLLPPMEQITLADLEAEVRRTTWDENFFKLMWNRLLMGRIRYGRKDLTKQIPYDYPGSIKKKIEQYIATGNTELLVDIGNYAMLKFRFGQHPQKHFAATDDADHCKVKE